MMNDKATGRKLRIYRCCFELTRDELAKALDVTVSSVAKYERGERRPSDDIKTKYANLFKVSEQVLFYD